MGPARPILATVSYVWGLNIWGKCQGHSSRESYICKVRNFVIFGVFDYFWGGVQPLALALGSISLWHYIPPNTVYKRGKFGFSGPFSFGDINAEILHFVRWPRRHGACR